MSSASRPSISDSAFEAAVKEYKEESKAETDG
jgi:hypothetical protein